MRVVMGWYSAAADSDVADWGRGGLGRDELGLGGKAKGCEWRFAGSQPFFNPYIYCREFEG
jgi:hypothetical protein